MRLARRFGVAAHTEAANVPAQDCGKATTARTRHRLVGRQEARTSGSLDVRSRSSGSSAEAERRSYEGSDPGSALQVEPTTERLDAVREPAKARAAGHARTAVSVVADLDDDLLG